MVYIYDYKIIQKEQIEEKKWITNLTFTAGYPTV